MCQGPETGLGVGDPGSRNTGGDVDGQGRWVATPQHQREEGLGVNPNRKQQSSPRRRHLVHTHRAPWEPCREWPGTSRGHQEDQKATQPAAHGPAAPASADSQNTEPQSLLDARVRPQQAGSLHAGREKPRAQPAQTAAGPEVERGHPLAATVPEQQGHEAALDFCPFPGLVQGEQVWPAWPGSPIHPRHTGLREP